MVCTVQTYCTNSELFKTGQSIDPSTDTNAFLYQLLTMSECALMSDFDLLKHLKEQAIMMLSCKVFMQFYDECTTLQEALQMFAEFHTREGPRARE